MNLKSISLKYQLKQVGINAKSIFKEKVQKTYLLPVANKNQEIYTVKLSFSLKEVHNTVMHTPFLFK